MSAKLLSSRRFLPLFVTQFFNALNDNLLRNAMVLLVSYKLASGASGQMLAALALAAFILPSFLLSATAGRVADKFEKARLIVLIKAIEIPILLAGAFGLFIESLPLLFLSLFLAGTQSTFFAPVKYGVLPELLRREELLAGNAYIEAATFLAILVGTLAGSALILTADGPAIVGATLVLSSTLSFATALLIPRGKPAASDLILSWRIAADTRDVLRHAAGDRALWLPILGISWFWAVGAMYLTLFPSLVQARFGADEAIVSVLLTVFALGIGVGSLMCTRLLRGEVTPKYVPVGALGLALFSLDLYAAIGGIPTGSAAAAGGLSFLMTPAHWRMLVDLFLVAVSGGFFIVPLYAFLQAHSEERHRARVIAANNIMNALFIVAGAAVLASLSAANVGARETIFIMGLAGIAVAIYVIRIIPDETLKLLVTAILKALYRVDVRGLENLKTADTKAVIVVNHVSFLDAAIVGAFLPGRPLFAINTRMAQRWWVRPLLRLVDSFTLDPTKPLAFRAIARAVEAGRQCVIFPEGRLTVTGSLMKIYEGPGLIADRAQAPVIPILLDGVQFLPFTRLRGKVKTQAFPKITMTILPPHRLEIPDDAIGRRRRLAVGRALHDVMSNLAFVAEQLDATLFEGLLRAARRNGAAKPVLEDAERKPLTYRRLISASLALGHQFSRLTGLGASVGVLLPTSNTAAVTFFALQAIGRVPALLNFTSGAAGLTAACTATKIDVIVTARRFVTAAKLEQVIGELPTSIRIVYLEDVQRDLAPKAKLIGLLGRVAPRLVYRRPKGVDENSPAVVLFTSGSEGAPKGVVLSHRNLLANRAQVSAVVDFGPTDIVFNALPVFHAFGLTGGLLLPLLSGVRTFLYPSPLHYRIVPELIYDTNATIVFGTDTFLAGYARVANPYDFYSVRYVFAGAERVKAETRQAFVERFGLRILEGYGATETSPVLALNTPMHCKPGTVGRFLPGVETQLEDVPGVDGGKRLFVRGANVMKGYLKVDRPGELQPPPEGWYDTGDLVAVDGEGFVTILGRAKRFAKIAGEMVSLAAVEELVGSVWGEATHAVVAVPDPKRGEALILITTTADADRSALLKAAQAKGLPELWVPRTIRKVDKLPLLGTGKTDYPAVEAIAREAATAAPA